MDIVPLASAGLFGVGFVAAITVWTDWRRREIPNWILACLLGGWALAAVAVPEVLDASRWQGLLCGGVGLALGFGLHAYGALGGGDGKLAAVLAMWLGPRDVGFMLLGAAILFLGMLLLARSGAVRDFRQRGVPFAWALAPPAVGLLVARGIALNG